ncbi:MAG: ABC transporter ATP-binding protein [Deltaproteobacteria bacterium]|nr:ABC transporter ATP-binding protein [Deltaproteobacteria bacterium]
MNPEGGRLGSSPPVIRLVNVTKRFGRKAALDKVSLELGAGEVVGVLGPNGAGKSTLLKLVTGIYAPLEGKIEIFGLDRYRDGKKIRQRVSYVPDNPYLPPQFSPRQWIDLVGRIYRVASEIRLKRLDELLDLFSLKEVADKPLQAVSNGQYKKTALAGGFMSGCELLVFDEPFTGEIDPPAQLAFKELVRSWNGFPGHLVLLTTQIVDQAEKLCDRILLIHDGHIVAGDLTASFRERFGGRSLEEILLDFSGVTVKPEDFVQNVFGVLPKGEA